MRDILQVCAVVIFAFFFVIFVIGGLAHVTESRSCANYEDITGRSTIYTFFGGCFVETENGWLTKGEYGKVIVARDGLTSGM